MLWWVLPGLVIVAVLAYVLGAVVGHVNPPVVPVQGLSMRPAIQGGDLVFLESVNPQTLHKGDIIAVNVPASDQKQYGLPAHIVHRIYKVNHNPVTGLSFVTKGDANAGPDVFTTQPNDVIGKLRFVIPGAGYPFLFLHSRQGVIFLGAAGLLLLLYFGLGLVEDRRVIVEGTAATMQSVLAETHELREAVEVAKQFAAKGASAVPWSGTTGRHDTDELTDEVRLTRDQSEETKETMRELVSAIGEYGIHLRSHTAVMQNLAVVTGELQRATVSLQVANEESPRGKDEQKDPSATRPRGVLPLSFAAPDVSVVDPSSLPPELLVQRDSLAVTTARIDGLLHELSTRLGSANVV
ncbi:MAG TPA: signal peptidase I [Acidimicrobiales bacterium]|nr:signal peptidase I [Acidimicrobiales bacterium]